MRMMFHLVVEKKIQVFGWESKFFSRLFGLKKKSTVRVMIDRDRESAFVRLTCPNLKISLLLCVT